LYALTGIRFLAASYVVIFHTRVADLLSRQGHRWLGNFVHNGYLAVPLFFLLSGFILAYTYAGRLRTHSDKVNFWEARIARIWPTYALSLLLTSIPSLIVPPAGPALATIMMVQAWNPWNPGMASSWNFMCWTLSVEAFFYLVFPWLQARLDGLPARSLSMLLGADLMLGVTANISAHGLGADPYPGVFRFIPLPVVHLPEFIGGAAMGNLFLRDCTAKSGGWTYLALGITLATLMLPAGPWTSVALIGFSALIYSLAKERTLISRVLSTRWLVFGGGISYAMYLLQTPVRGWFGTSLKDYSGNAWQFGIVPIVLTAVSALVYVYFEVPARRALRAMFAKFYPRVAQQSAVKDPSSS